MKKVYILIVFTLQLVMTGYAQQDTSHLHKYNDAEVLKITNKIKELEQKTADYRSTHPKYLFEEINANTAAEKIVYNDLDSFHTFNDAQVLKIARYIQYLEKADSLNIAEQTAIAAAKQRTADSLAAIAAQTTQVKGVEDYQNQINFDFDSYVIKKESYSALDEAVKILKKYDEMYFIVEGYTDDVGSDAYNLNLSRERAKAVMNYFVSKGVPANRISSTGYGESKPIASNETDAGRAKNRRVEIKSKVSIQKK